MTFHVVISCDGIFDVGRMPMACRGAYPTRDMDAADAERAARAAGWSISRDGDLCPAHARLQAKARADRGVSV